MVRAFFHVVVTCLTNRQKLWMYRSVTLGLENSAGNERTSTEVRGAFVCVCVCVCLCVWPHLTQSSLRCWLSICSTEITTAAPHMTKSKSLTQPWAGWDFSTKQPVWTKSLSSSKSLLVSWKEKDNMDDRESLPSSESRWIQLWWEEGPGSLSVGLCHKDPWTEANEANKQSVLRLPSRPS